MSDGKVIFSTRLDNKELEKDLQKTYRKIEKYEQDIAVKTRLKDKYSKRSDFLSVRLDSEKAKLYDMKNAEPGAFTKEQIAEQAEMVSQLQKEWNSVTAQAEKYDRQIEEATEKMNQQKQKAVDIAEKIEQATSKENKLDSVVGSTASRFEKLSSRIAKLAASALVFSTITKGLTLLRDWAGKVITSNDQASASLARLQGALLTMAQPLVSIIIPAFTTFINLLTAIVGKIADFLSALGGKTVQQSANAAKALNKQAGAIGGVGDAAEDAKKQLMGFDEINKLSSVDTPSGGGGGGGTSDIQPDFGWSEGITETLDRIADLVLLIGTGFALWKISELIPGQLGSILGKLGLLMAALGGLLLMWDGIQDAWENGVDWGNLTEMLLGLAVAAGALYLAFGPLAAGIVLVVGGIALLVTAFHDIMENGFTLQNTLLAIAAIFATGLGISLLTGSFIPLLIAAIASLLLAFTVATGNGEELIAGLKDVCQGFLDFFTGLFTGDMDMAMSGLKTMFSGLLQIGSAVFSGLMDAAGELLSWLNDKTGGAINDVIGFINNMIAAVCNGWNKLASLLSFDLPGIGAIGLPRITNIPQIPYLAKGAVIPPNREFLAVLGDQTHGRNLEAPEDLIRQIIREEIGNMGFGDISINFIGELAALARILTPVITREQRRASIAGGR